MIPFEINMIQWSPKQKSDKGAAAASSRRLGWTESSPHRRTLRIDADLTEFMPSVGRWVLDIPNPWSDAIQRSHLVKRCRKSHNFKIFQVKVKCQNMWNVDLPAPIRRTSMPMIANCNWPRKARLSEHEIARKDESKTHSKVSLEYSKVGQW